MRDFSNLDPQKVSKTREYAFKKVMPILRTRARGEYITHQEITKVTGIEPYSTYWGLLIHHVKKMCMNELGIELFHEKGRFHTYKLATYREQLIDNVDNREERAGRQLFRGRKSLGALPDSELDERQRQVKYHRIESLKIKQDAIKEKEDFMAAMAPKRNEKS